MSWEDVEIDKEKLMDVKGELQSSADLPPFIQGQMFDVDTHGFPVFTDKNRVLLDVLFKNDVAYSKVITGEYEAEMKEIFKGMFNADTPEEQQTNIRRAVYRVNRDNSTSLPTLSGSKKETASGKPTQKYIVELLKISSGERLDGKEPGKKAKKEPGKEAENKEYEKKLTGGSLLTARAIIDMIPFDRNLNKGVENALLAGEADLVYKIAHAAEETVNNALMQETERENDSGIAVKRIDKNNFSFATKFCHHACKRISEGSNEYCIYDSVVHEFLPYYACEYLDADTLGKICGFKLERTTNKEQYKKVNEQIEAWKKLSAQDASEKGEGYGYESYRNLYDAVLDAINKWRDAWRLCPNNQSRVIHHHRYADLCKKLDYCNFDRFVWYYYKNQWRKEEAKKLLKVWEELPYNL